MTKINNRHDCGNSPKNRLVQDLTIAIACADASRIAALTTIDVRWLPVGRKPVTGADAICKAITRYGPATSLIIEQVISHGRGGAVNGVVEFGPKRRAFCNVFEFASAKGGRVKTVTSYSVALAEQG
jgi:hypothetical protein